MTCDITNSLDINPGLILNNYNVMSGNLKLPVQIQYNENGLYSEVGDVLYLAV